MLKAAQAYFQTQVSTTSQGHLLIMLYDGAIKFLKQAKVKIQEKNYAEKGMLISRAMDVINELDSSLNRAKGGDLAVNLHNLYFFCNTRLLNANLRMDCGLIDEVIKILTGLRDAFAQIQGMPQSAARPAVGPGAPATETPAPHAATPQPQPASAQEPAMPGPSLRAAAPVQAPPAPQPAPRTTSQGIKPPPAPTFAHKSAPPPPLAPAPSTASATGAQPKAGDQLPPPKPTAGKLLARSNLYKKMSTQT